MSKSTFTWEELRQKNNESDAYVAIRQKVYNVTKFIDQHPGGRDALLMAAGRDVTLVFESYHGLSDRAPKVLAKYYVGELISHKYPTYPEPGLFHKTVKERVKKYFKDNNKDPKDPETMWIRIVLLPLLTLALMYAQMAWLADSLLWSTIAGITTGWFMSLIAMTHVHDSCHFAITHSPWVWTTIGVGMHNFFLGASWHVWMLQHVFGHHPYTNIEGSDPDISTAEKHPDIRRIKDTQTWIIPYLAQHIYGPIIYGFLGLKTQIQDCFVILKGRNSTMSMNGFSRTGNIIFWLGKVWYIILWVLIPLKFLPFSRVLWINILSTGTVGYYLALIFQISHVVSEVEWPQPNKDNHVPHDWAELQIATTLDYATDNWFCNTFTGALNHQAAHHLFPGISQIHYPQITPIVRKTCEEFNLRYNYLPSFSEALGAHFSHLKRLGQNPDARTADARSG